MKIVCSWCKKFIGEKEPLDDKSESHTKCDGCIKLMIELWTAEEVARFLKVSLGHVRKLTSRRLIPFTKVGRSVRYPQAKIMGWLEVNTREPRRMTTFRKTSKDKKQEDV